MLSDGLGRIHNYLRISLTEACNFRCTYCMPENMLQRVPATYMSADEIVRLTEIFIAAGVKRIRLTGGEPLVRKDFPEILEKLSPHAVMNGGKATFAISTNGLLAPRFIPQFRQAGINTINISLDSLKPDRFLNITGRDSLTEVLSNIKLLQDKGFGIKINTVIMRGVNDDELNHFVEWTRTETIEVRFIEFMPFEGNSWSPEMLLPYSQMLNEISGFYDVIPREKISHETSINYRVRDFAGSFGFINTMTHPFCGDCNRLRLTADGRIKNCLFGKDEVDVITPLRAGEDIVPLINASLMKKHASWGGQDLFSETQNRSMIAIGG